MVVEQIDNPANKQMSYGKDRKPVGVIPVPQTLPKKTIYTGAEAMKQYNELQRDLYMSEKAAKKKPIHKFPTIMKILLGFAGISGLIIFRKNISKMIRNLFRRKN